MTLTAAQMLKVYLKTVPIFFLIDMVWLGLLAKNFYNKHLGYLFRPNINWTAAIIFYLLFILGILIFAVKPALEGHSLAHAMIYGALFGFFTYATYDLTNLATVRDWPLIVTIVDLLWGTILCGSVASISYLLSK